ncbi:hypothetical protein DEO72_LG2g5424 [Vigna unguiculata]|uniref:Uncharacterized protein n=1 Tax=Vigna unguiculata TaxID=3917 RepID=A0A4D6L9I1_VIGUN|nr:hypothetical protein DEO72_LG2g5424 [Vigna unguiculata]
MMKNPSQHVPAAEVPNRNRFRNTKSSLKRGQIKSKIVDKNDKNPLTEGLAVQCK